IDSRQKARNVDQCNNWNIKAIAKADKSGSLDGSVDIEGSSQHRRIVGYNSDAAAIKAREAYNDISGECLMDFQELTAIGHPTDDFPNIIGLIRIGRHQIGQG